MRRIVFEYELLGKNGQLKKRLSNITKASVRYASLGRLKGSANILMREDPSVDYINDRIKVFCVLNNQRHDLGEYLICSTKREINGDTVTRECQCYSKLKLLDDDKIEDRHVCNIGTNAINEVKRLIGEHPYSLEDSNLTLQTAKEWAVGTPKLTIINDLLDIINWTGLRVGLDGSFTASPYILPIDREVEFNLLTDENSILYPEKTDELDLFNTPNVVILRTNAAEVSPPLQAVYVNNHADSLTSTVSRGRRIVHFEEINDVVDQVQLNVQAKKRLYELSDIYNNVNINTAIQPEAFGYMRCLYLKTGTVEGKFLQTSCEIHCEAGGKMTRTLRRAIKL